MGLQFVGLVDLFNCPVSEMHASVGEKIIRFKMKIKILVNYFAC